MPNAVKTLQLLDQAKAAGKPLRRSAQDSQKSKLYRAEQVLRTGDTLLTERQIVALIAKIRSSAYVTRNYGDPGVIQVTVSGRHTRRSLAYIEARRMVLAKGWGQQRNVVIHELAHFYASPMGDPGHGWLFCHIYLDFVRKFMGEPQAAALKASFKRNKVAFAPPRKRKAMTPAQKAAASERMAKARAARNMASVEPHVFIVPKQQFGETRWGVVVGSTVPKSGWLKTSFRPFNRWDELSDSVLVRKSDTGVVQALSRIRTWPGAQDAMAVPVSKLKDWVSA